MGKELQCKLPDDLKEAIKAKAEEQRAIWGIPDYKPKAWVQVK